MNEGQDSLADMVQQLLCEQRGLHTQLHIGDCPGFSRCIVLHRFDSFRHPVESLFDVKCIIFSGNDAFLVRFRWLSALFVYICSGNNENRAASWLLVEILSSRHFLDC